MSVVKLLGIDGDALSVVGLDCLDGTPLLDIKPYFASTDSVPDAVGGLACKRKDLTLPKVFNIAGASAVPRQSYDNLSEPRNH